MTFNHPDFIREFAAYVAALEVNRILEVGCLSGELADAVGAEGIDIAPRRADVVQADIRAYSPPAPYDLVFSSGVLEHYSPAEAVDLIRAKAAASRRYVLTYVPSTECEAYKRHKASTTAAWRHELDYTPDGLAALHEMAGLTVVDKGYAGAGWAARWGPEPSGPYLVYCLATVHAQG